MITFKGVEIYPNRSIWVSVDGRDWELATISEIGDDFFNLAELPFIVNHKTEEVRLWGQQAFCLRVGYPYDFEPGRGSNSPTTGKFYSRK